MTSISVDLNVICNGNKINYDFVLSAIEEKLKREKKEALTEEELLKNDGKPVYRVSPFGGRWELIKVKNEMVSTYYGICGTTVETNFSNDYKYFWNEMSEDKI